MGNIFHVLKTIWSHYWLHKLSYLLFYLYYVSKLKNTWTNTTYSMILLCMQVHFLELFLCFILRVILSGSFSSNVYKKYYVQTLSKGCKNLII